MDNQQQQVLQTVIEAASAVVSPHTAPNIRAEASKYLEGLTQSDTSWPIFAQWISFEQSLEVRLLNLQLLQTKIRKQVRYQGTNDNTLQQYLDEIRNNLEAFAVASFSVDASKIAATPACICLAAILIRTTNFPQLIGSLIAARTPLSHGILAQVPVELMAVSDLTTTAAATVLQTTCHALLTYVQEAAAVDVLANWVNVSRITLTQIAHFPVLFDGLLTLLGSDDPTKSAQILQEALVVPTDCCTPTRMAACQRILSSIPTWNFNFDDRAKLVATFTTEEIDILITQPSDELLSILLKLQRSSDISVRCAILECWLSVSDKPINDRHENWGKLLFQHVTKALLETVCLDEDEDDRAEYQRLCGDVLVDCYCLLRLDFLELLVSAAISSTQLVLSSLVCLNAVAREVNGRSKTMPAADRGQIAGYISQLIPLLGPNVESAQFVGRFAPTWAVNCKTEDLLHLLALLMRSIISPDELLCVEASMAIKQLLVNTSNTLKEDGHVLKYLQTLVQAALTTYNESALANVTEGCIRTGYDAVEIAKPIVQMAEFWLEATTDPFALDHLACCLNALIVVLRFSESSTQCYTYLSPFLKKVSEAYVTIDPILEKLLGIERQILVLSPIDASTRFPATLAFVLDAFAARYQPFCLNFFGTAVESLTESSHDVFREPIIRLSMAFCEMVKKCSALEQAPTIEAFYDMVQRCLLFSPGAIVASGQLPSITACAVDCLEACKCERESTRAILNFLTKMYGWKFLPTRETLQKGLLDQELPKHGARASTLCIRILGSSQALAPPCADCIYSIVCSSDPGIAYSWLSASCNSYDQKVSTFVIQHLLGLAAGGKSNKSKASMLLRDFAMIEQGKLSPETLVSYTLP